MMRRLIARAFWAVSRWKLVGEPAPGRPTVLIGAPHTSNWDFVLMLAIAWRLGVDIRWLGKASLFHGWRAPLMRRLGGIPVDRADPRRVVSDVVARIRTGEVFGLVVTPDGTRGNTTHWKSGFYRIARESGMPVTLCFVDRTTRTCGIGPTFDLSGDVTADMDRIRAFYADKSGFRPARRAEPRLREEDADAVTVRRVVPGDAGEVLTVQRAAFVSEALIYGSPDMPPLTQTLEQLRAELAENDGWVAQKGSRLVGALRAIQDGDLLMIGRIAIAPDMQGEGIGRALLEAAEAGSTARESELFTGSLSEANIRLYERCGYVETQRVPQDDGTEQVWMRKRLDRD
jgi:1-acyl-sn-glycerol-3-phosphate acyltransferase/ribosomal protein S18 acetylase RimI-like enzyme